MTHKNPDARLAAPELLAPAGDPDCVRAALENGADAIYFGLDDGFNARARATNFGCDQLPEILRLVHQRGVRGYVTLNTLAFPSELAALEALIRQIASAGVDAVLVQDLGVARLVRSICPELEIHASTQMTMTSAETIREAERLGVARVVVGRELSIAEIAKIRSATDMPLEAFVHGALCVAYSGQCLTSESLGGRSANRGQCAQACRLPYDLFCDGEPRDLGAQKYLLSPQDLAGYELVPELIAAGVCSLKIEGRLKTAEYVANITRHYRRAIDAAIEQRRTEIDAEDVREMEMSFSRGFSSGWLQGCDHKALVPGLSSAKRGVLLGSIRSVKTQGVLVQLAAPVARGDGVVFEGDRASGTEQGGRVYEVLQSGRSVPRAGGRERVELRFGRGEFDFTRLEVGQRIWKTDDPQLTKRLRATFSGPDAIRRVPVDVRVTAAVGRPLEIEAAADNGAHATLASEQPLEQATRHPIDEPLLRKQLGRLGGSVYQLRDLEAQLDGAPMVPLSVLGALRRNLISELDASLASRPPRRVSAEPMLPRLREQVAAAAGNSPLPPTGARPRLWVLCRSPEQLEVALAERPEGVYLEFHDIRQYRDAVGRARDAGIEVFVATLRIQKPGEFGLLRVLARSQPSGLLVRNLAALRFCADNDIPAVGDFSLNVANELSASHLMQYGPRRLTASYDLNRQQLLDLAEHVPPSWLEVVIHQHMPMFHMEHCVFCAVLSPGTNKTNCGRPCDQHVVHLRDRVGKSHPLTADVGCRNTLYNATPQSGAEAVPELIERGIRSFRVELLEDAPHRAAEVIRLYRGLLDGTHPAAEVWRELKASNRVGVTRGTLEQRRDPLAIL